MPAYKFSADAEAHIDAPVQSVFGFLDDQANLSAHMSERSWMMMGSTMDIFMDEQATRAVGSRFEANVVERNVPADKAGAEFQTTPLVIYDYQTL